LLFVKQLNNSTISGEARRVVDLLFDTVPVVMTALRAELRHHRPGDLSVTQARTLFFIHRQAGVSPSVVAEHLDLTLSSVSKLVDGLVARGHLRREVSSEDRRRCCLFITRSGREIVAAARRQVGQVLMERLGHLDDQALAEVAAGTEHLRQVFPSVAPSPAESASDASNTRRK
jgi:MarR family transcriptional regulator, negative regulator of the multidrug operon emrRAB